MKRFYVIDTSEILRAVSDPLRIQILFYLLEDEYTGKQLSDILNLAPSKVHYHLRELEQHGLIEVVRTEEKNGIMQKFFRDVALNYVVSETLLPSLQGNTVLIQELVLNSLRMAIRRVYNAPEDSFLFSAQNDENAPPLVNGSYEIKGTRKEIQSWLKKYKSLVQELLDIDKKYEKQAQFTEYGQTYELFYLMNAGFLINHASFEESENEEDSFEYELTSDLVVRKCPNGSDRQNEK